VDSFLQRIFDWSEVWSLFIPMLVLAFNRKQPAYLKPVIIYLWLALPLNLVCDIIADYYEQLPTWLQYNNPLYNIHSLLRFACFGAFFLLLKQSFFPSLEKVILFVFVGLVALNFVFVDRFFNGGMLSGNLLAAEAYFLLIYCLLYYLSQLKKDVEVLMGGPEFWIVTGLCVYVVINFFVFLFYVPMMQENPELAALMWNVHNVAYILLNSFIAKAFHEPVGSFHRS
jgi:hypothetical protein